jgi:hypothetical protein
MTRGEWNRPLPTLKARDIDQRVMREARHVERLERPPVEAMRRDPQVPYERRQAPARVVERADEGLLSGARRLTNRAFDALDEVGNWVTGHR